MKIAYEIGDWVEDALDPDTKGHIVAFRARGVTVGNTNGERFFIGYTRVAPSGTTLFDAQILFFTNARYSK